MPTDKKNEISKSNIDPNDKNYTEELPEEQFEESYLDVNVHKMMLQDVVRTEAYERAIQKVVKPEHTVMDFGCGTGVLSIFSSRAGAKQVHAVDRTKFIRIAKKIAEQNDVSNICFHHDDHNSVELDEKVDVLVSEWMGHFLFYENMLNPLLKLRNKYLKPGGTMIPSEVSLHAGLITDKEVFEDLSYFKEPQYGIDFSQIGGVPFEQITTEFFQAKQLMKQFIPLGSLDLSIIDAQPEVLTGTITADDDTTVYGICGWFDSTLAEGIHLNTGPKDPYTHWSHMHFPLEEPFEIKKGKEITIEIAMPNGEEPLGDKWEWSITDGEKYASLDNMRYRERERYPLKPGILK